MLTTIASFREPWEAHMFRGRLESEGVPAMVVFEHHVGVAWPWSTALGWVKVQVPRSWAKEAFKILSRARAGEFAKELEDEWGDLDDPECPACGSQEYWIRRTTYQVLFCGVLSFFLGTATPPWTWLCNCEICGTKWKRGHLMFLPMRIGEFSEI